MQWTKSISILSTSRAPPKCGFFLSVRAGASAVASQRRRRRMNKRASNSPRDVTGHANASPRLSRTSLTLPTYRNYSFSSRRRARENKSDPQRSPSTWPERDNGGGRDRPRTSIRNIRGGGKAVVHARFTRGHHTFNGINLHAPRLNETDWVSAPWQQAHGMGRKQRTDGLCARRSACSARGYLRKGKPPFRLSRIIQKWTIKIITANMRKLLRVLRFLHSFNVYRGEFNFHFAEMLQKDEFYLVTKKWFIQLLERRIWLLQYYYFSTIFV